MCKPCNNLKIKGLVSEIIDFMDYMDLFRPLTRDHDKCYRSLDLYLGSLTVEDAEGARLAISRVLGEPEPELYNDPSPPLYEGCEQELEQFIELQARIEKGETLIERASRVISAHKWAGYIYNAWKGRYPPQKCGEILSDPRNKDLIQWIEYRSTLWSHKFQLNKKARKLATGNGVYPQYVALVTGDEDLQYDPIAHKRPWQEVDSRMLTSDEAYFLSHQEELEELHI